MHFTKSPLSIATVSALFLAVCSAHAATYATQITGTDNATLFQANHLEVEWSTSATFGASVSEIDLSDLRISIYDDSNALVYSDVVISAGVVQPIGGLVRGLSDISFSGTAGVSIADFDNDLNQIQLSSASGITFNIYGNALSLLNIAKYSGGALIEDASFADLSQITTAIPEPASVATLAGVLGFAFAAARRRRLA